MNIFNSIVDKIFSHKDAAAAPNPSMPSPIAQPQVSQNTTAQASNQSASVDVMSILQSMAQKNPQKLNWQTSIVDLLKLLGLDSSLEARTQLAKELNYTGDIHDSAAMNVWLQQQVMQKIAQNGGRVPADLLH